MNENTPIMAGTGDNTRTTPDTADGLRAKLNEISNPVKKIGIKSGQSKGQLKSTGKRKATRGLNKKSIFYKHSAKSAW